MSNLFLQLNALHPPYLGYNNHKFHSQWKWTGIWKWTNQEPTLKKIKSMHLRGFREYYTHCCSMNTLVGIHITADDNTRMIYTWIWRGGGPAEVFGAMFWLVTEHKRAWGSPWGHTVIIGGGSNEWTHSPSVIIFLHLFLRGVIRNVSIVTLNTIWQ